MCACVCSVCDSTQISCDHLSIPNRYKVKNTKSWSHFPVALNEYNQTMMDNFLFQALDVYHIWFLISRWMRAKTIKEKNMNKFDIVKLAVNAIQKICCKKTSRIDLNWSESLFEINEIFMFFSFYSNGVIHNQFNRLPDQNWIFDYIIITYTLYSTKVIVMYFVLSIAIARGNELWFKLSLKKPFVSSSTAFPLNSNAFRIIYFILLCCTNIRE